MAPKDKQANISKVLPPIPPHPSKKILEKSKFFIKNLVFSLTKNLSKKSLYAQASKININEIIRISETTGKQSIRNPQGIKTKNPN